MKNYQERVPTNIMLKLTLNGDNKLKRKNYTEIRQTHMTGGKIPF